MIQSLKKWIPAPGLVSAISGRVQRNVRGQGSTLGLNIQEVIESLDISLANLNTNFKNC